MPESKGWYITGKQTGVVVLALSLMIFSWMMDAALDANFETGGFFKQFITPGPHDLALRLWYVVTLCFFLFYISHKNREHRQQETRLKAALRNGENERVRAQAVLECMGDAVSMQDLDMRILYQNQAHIDLMGSHLGEFCYQAYQHQGEVCRGCHLAQSFLDGQVHKVERHAYTPNGLRFTEIISTPLRDASGRIIAGIESVRDITERKRTDLEIERMNKELELRALELAEANRELESFSYSLSHDLRSYITRISTAEQILSQTPQAAEPDLSYPVQVIRESCRGMEDLVEAILTLSRLSREAMHWEEISLEDMAQELALQLQQQEPKRRVEWVIAQGMRVRGDRNLLRVVLENLLSNAWKYTATTPAARIELGSTFRDGRRTFFVRDNGVGFDMAEKGKLFKPFQRLRNSQGFAGTGIGLATVDRAIQRHCGKVWAEGEPGQGAVFYFTLPEQAA